jgi:DNA replication and repair protein RecF
VAEDIPEDWDARRVEIRMTEDDGGRVSMVQS